MSLKGSRLHRNLSIKNVSFREPVVNKILDIQPSPASPVNFIDTAYPNIFTNVVYPKAVTASSTVNSIFNDFIPYNYSSNILNTNDTIQYNYSERSLNYPTTTEVSRRETSFNDFKTTYPIMDTIQYSQVPTTTRAFKSTFNGFIPYNYSSSISSTSDSVKYNYTESSSIFPTATEVSRRETKSNDVKTQFIKAAVATPVNFIETAYPPVVNTVSTYPQVFTNDFIQYNYTSRPSDVKTTTAIGTAVVPAQAPSQVEETIYRSVNPPALAGSEVVSVAGQTGLWTNKHEIESWRGDIPLSQYVIHNDAAPQIVRKKPAQNVLYNQEIAVRYLNPPNPAPHGDIVIKEQPNIPTGPAPPIVLRQEPPRPVTPPALILREAPPRAPSPLPPKFLAIPGKRIPPPPRKVVVEKLPILPSKPQSIFIERWLPFKEQTRRVVFERNTVPDPIVQIPRNVIVEWESPDVTVKKDFKDLGIVNADPIEYERNFNVQLKTVDEFPEFVRGIRPPPGLLLATDYRRSAVPRLVGDLQALSLIDLDKAGLSEYKSLLSNYSYVPLDRSSLAVEEVVGAVSIASYLENALSFLNINSDGFITSQEAQNLFFDLSNRFGRSYGFNDLRNFLNSLNLSREGWINRGEFKHALYNHFLL